MKHTQVKLTYQKIKKMDEFTQKLLKNKNLQPAFYITLLQLKKDIKIALSFWGNLQQSAYSKKEILVTNNTKLQIGCGKRYIPSFINLDIFPPADIIWDCRYGLPFHNNIFNFIFSEHFLEHLDFPISVKNVLREMYRILKPKGEVVIGVPDGQKVIKAYSKRNKKFMDELKQKSYEKRKPRIEINGHIDFVNYIFRDQLENPEYSIHYWAYDEESLGNILRSIGFSKVEKYRFNPAYCNPKRKFFTLYLKATK